MHHHHDNKYADLSADVDNREYLPLEDLKPHQLIEIADGTPPANNVDTPMDQCPHQSLMLHQHHHHHHQQQLAVNSHRITPSNYAEYHPQNALMIHVPMSSTTSGLAQHQSSELMCLQMPSFDYQLSDGTLHTSGSSSYYDLNDAAMHSVQYDE